MLERQLSELAGHYRRLLQRHSETERRMDNMFRYGKVTEVDTKKHLCRMEIASKDGKVTKSPWRPYSQFGGSDGESDNQGGGGGSGGSNEGKGELKVHAPPSKGQQMMFISPGGEARQGIAIPFTWHEKAKSPSEESDPVITRGKIKVTVKKEQVTAVVGDVTFDLEKDKATLKIGDGSALTMTKDTTTFKNTKHVFEGEVLLGGAGASREVVLRDSTTSDGDTVIGNLSTKVKAI